MRSSCGNGKSQAWKVPSNLKDPRKAVLLLIKHRVVETPSDAGRHMDSGSCVA